MIGARLRRRNVPTIGVTGPARGGAIAWWFTRRAVLAAGGRPVRISPRQPRADRGFDALIIGGGAHVSTPGMPAAVQAGGSFDPARDEFELARLHQAVGDDTPVLGICRGAQLMNVYAGGSLLRDLAPLYQGLGQGHGRPPRPSARARRRVQVVDGSRLHAAVGRDAIRVNALHRHAVGRVGRQLRVVAEDAAGVVQAVEHVDHPFWIGVQWHPEYLPHLRAQRRLFAALVRAARDHSSGARRKLQQRDRKSARPHDPTPVTSSHRSRHAPGSLQVARQS